MFKVRMLRSAVVAALIAAFIPVSAFGQHFQQQNLVVTALPSPTPTPAPTVDGNLQNPWGLASGYNPTTATGTFGPSNWWVSDASNGVTTLYNGVGQFPPTNQLFIVPTCVPVQLSGSNVSSQGSPTGQVFSGSTTDFLIPQLSNVPARFIFATLDGAISAWNPVAQPPNENSQVFNQVTNCGTASYTGITIIVNGSKQFLLAADFKTGKIDCFDATFAPCTFTTSTTSGIATTATPDGTFPSDAFTDTTLTPDANTTVVPFNVQASGGLVYVTYAEKNSSGGLVTGANTGFVNAYTVQGKLVHQYGKIFNAPWGVAQAGVFFGAFSHALLIGNHGDGTIHAFDASTGRSLGKMLTADTTTSTHLVIPGLFSLHFGNDAAFTVATPPLKGSGPAMNLFFTASNQPGLTSTNGVVGTITPIDNERAGANVF
jgi:uncharacterized protein (TIGR03118 family)